MAEEDSDKVGSLDGDGARPFSPSKWPNYLPLSRSSTGLQRTLSSEPLLRRQRSRQVGALQFQYGSRTDSIPQFSQTSIDTNSILLPRRSRTQESSSDSDDSQTQWHSASLLFVALPAFAGMFFENGSAVMTDMLMLGLGCLFLYWSVKWPWLVDLDTFT